MRDKSVLSAWPGNKGSPSNGPSRRFTQISPQNRPMLRRSTPKAVHVRKPHGSWSEVISQKTGPTLLRSPPPNNPHPPLPSSTQWLPAVLPDGRGVHWISKRLGTSSLGHSPVRILRPHPVVWNMAMGQKPVPPVNISIPTKID